MKRIHMENMKEYGLHFVTGEACGLNMRALYGFETPEVWEATMEFFAIKGAVPNPFVTNYYSTMLLPRVYIPLLFVYIIMKAYEEYSNEVLYIPEQETESGIRHSMTIYVKEGEYDKYYDEVVERYRNSELNGRFFKKSTAPGTGFRNLHHFTGMIG